MGKIVVKPRFAICYGECYDNTDFFKVAEIEPYGTVRSDGSISAYYRYLYGLMDCAGRLVFPFEYHDIKPALVNERLYTGHRGDWHLCSFYSGVCREISYEEFRRS